MISSNGVSGRRREREREKSVAHRRSNGAVTADSARRLSRRISAASLLQSLRAESIWVRAGERDRERERAA